MKRSLRARDRKGQSLILLLFILIALIGVMALTLDFGFVLLARRQMQTGVNAAALEGGRFQDDYPPLSTLVSLLDDPSSCEEPWDQQAVLECLRDEAGCESSDDACLRDYIRRKAARHVLRLNFDDDFDLRSNQTTIGAGIDSSLIQGHEYQQTTIGPGDRSVSEILKDRSSYIFRPDGFELNRANKDHGDMVVGFYDMTDPDHREFVYQVDPEDPLSETYARTDFSSLETSGYLDAFLIRMRRTHVPDPDDGDDTDPENDPHVDEEPGVSSRGGGLPLMLARAGWMRAEDESADYSVRRDGITVRATAIAQGTPARVVSAALPDTLYADFAGTKGATPFIIERGYWSDETNWTDPPREVEIGPHGQNAGGTVRLVGVTSLAFKVSDTATSIDVHGTTTGFPVSNVPFKIRIGTELLSVTAVTDSSWTVERGIQQTRASEHSSGDIVVLHTGRILGDPVGGLTSVPPDEFRFEGQSFHQYVPIFEKDKERIVGFGYVTWKIWKWDLARKELTVTRMRQIVAPGGVTASLVAPLSGELSSDEIQALWSANSSLRDDDGLLAPALVRTIR